jgi:hypothetical protein
MTLPDGESLINAVIEQRIAEMSDQDFNALVSRRRPPADANPKPAKERMFQMSAARHPHHLARPPTSPPPRPRATGNAPGDSRSRCSCKRIPGDQSSSQP